MIQSHSYFLSSHYAKALAVLEKSLRTGRFARYSQQKKQQLWDCLCHYASQLGIKIKASVVVACMAAGLSLATPAQAQLIFTAQTGANNPLNAVNTYQTKPVFVDIDGDGDMDAFIGPRNGGTVYYKNTGTVTAPVFTLTSGASNPLNGIGSTGFAPTSLAFADMDGDGDKDVFIIIDGTINYYKNTGSATVPAFTLQAFGSNPLNAVGGDVYNSPVLVDIDGDGDIDAFIGRSAGTILYYKNTGSSTVAAFTLQSGAANPFNGVDIGDDAVPVFGDIDRNGTMDAFIGAADGTISYYKNTGTALAPVLVAQAGAANPFNGVDIGSEAAPAVVDVNGDNKKDVFIGNLAGTVSYYNNATTFLPLTLLSFSGSGQDGYNQLQWQTADEVNTLQFGVESSADGTSFTNIATVNAGGSGNHHYGYPDKTASSGKVFYRLKMGDIDGRFTYSRVIWIDSRQQGAAVTLYPNPARNLVNIHLANTAMVNTSAGLYGANGSLLQTILITAPQQQINIQRLAKGSYVLKFADGTALGFIKE